MVQNTSTFLTAFELDRTFFYPDGIILGAPRLLQSQWIAQLKILHIDRMRNKYENVRLVYVIGYYNKCPLLSCVSRTNPIELLPHNVRAKSWGHKSGGNYASNAIENATPRILERREVVRIPAPLDPLVDEATEPEPARVPVPEPLPAPVIVAEPVGAARSSV